MIGSFEETYFETNGVRLHVVEAGPKEGKLAILLHGFPEFWYGWRKQIGPLAGAGLRVIAPDLRGYNLSDKPKEVLAYHLEEAAKDILGLIMSASPGKAAVVGHDWGGFVAWWLALRYPQFVERVAVLNIPHPAAVLPAVLRDPAQIRRSLYFLFFQLPWLPEAMARHNDWALVEKGMQGSSRPGTFGEEDFEHYRRAWWRQGAFTAMLNWYRAYFRRPLRIPADPRIHVPALILWGAQDVALGRVMADLSLKLCDQGELVFFEEASHWVQHEEAEAVNERLIGFLI
jgi:pimeloyl-ACP methyl ester carboxylesterase